MTVGTPNPRDAFSPILGQFDGGRSTENSVFSFIVETAGIYAFRIVWFQSGGGGSMEFFSVMDDETRVLVNDPKNAASIRAFRALKGEAVTRPYVNSVIPRPGETGTGLRPHIEIVLEDSESKLVTSTVELKLNETVVAPTITRVGTTVTVTYDPVSNLENLSENHLALAFQDGSGPASVSTRTWTFTTARVIKATGQWDFDNGDLSATYGSDLAYGDDSVADGLASGTEFGTTTVFGVSDINGAPASVMKYNRVEDSTDVQPGYLLQHCISPNGGGSQVNQWTLVMDIMFPDPQISPFSSIIQIGDPQTDGELFARWNDVGGEGTGGIGFIGQYNGDGRTFLKLDQWHRLAFAVDAASASPVISKYIDGVKFEDQRLTPPQLDGRHSLDSIVRLFSDENNQLNTFYVNSIQILNGKLTDSEIADLGGPAAAGIPPNPSSDLAASGPPRITIQRVSGAVVLSWPEDCIGYSLESSADLSGLNWVPVQGVTGTTLTVDLSSSSMFYRLRQ